MQYQILLLTVELAAVLATLGVALDPPRLAVHVEAVGARGCAPDEGEAPPLVARAPDAQPLSPALDGVRRRWRPGRCQSDVFAGLSFPLSDSQIVHLIQEHVFPHVGATTGLAVVEVKRGVLIVKGTSRLHTAVESFLDDLRSYLARPEADAGPVTPQSDGAAPP
jgi:hypothetical protein